MPNVLRDGRLDLELLSRLSTAPPVYDGEPLFWTDPHISSGMLEAHLDPNTDAASRRPETILKTVKWLSQYLRLPPGAKVIDLGCGPGLYCAHFHREGWKVTWGLDFSERSIAYGAGAGCEVRSRTIEYVQLSYLDWDESDKYDAAFIIYCDLGALKDPDRDVFLQNVFRALKPGGRFVFDVETPAHFAASVGGGQNSYWGATPQGFLEARAPLASVQDLPIRIRIHIWTSTLSSSSPAKLSSTGCCTMLTPGRLSCRS